MKDFKELEVWKRAHELNRFVHTLVKAYPRLARTAVAPQMQRASTAIAANIAEACGACENNGGRWYFNAALGSATSLEYLMFLAFDLRLIPEENAEWFTGMTVEVQGMLREMLGKKEPTRHAPASLTMVQ